MIHGGAVSSDRRMAPPSRLTLIALIAALALAACATPLERFQARLDAAGLSSEVVRGSAFDHLLVTKPGRANSPVHVYIEGDGTPWRTREEPAEDPTPRTPLAFELMQRDPHEAIYLGRPCYFGVTARNCNALVWTDQRYSEAVLTSMARALAVALDERADKRVLFIGHSGGGVLATLLARRVPQSTAVITVGANLDVAAWATLHDYTPLNGSLDPARLSRSHTDASAVPEHHFVGSNDRVVPPELVRSYARNRAAVELVEWPGFDHVCCWTEVWEQVLARLAE